MSVADIRTQLERRGVRWVQPPVLQPAGLYLELAGEDIRRRAFMIASNDGEEFCLRPDMTVPACRMALSEGLTPSVLAYEGLVFRRQTDETKESEFVQIGAEWCGLDADAAEIDAAIIVAALEAARAFAVEPQVKLGDVGLFLAVARALGWSETWVQRLARGFRRPDGLARVLDDARGEHAAPVADIGAELAGLPAKEAEARLAHKLAEAGIAHIGARSLAEIADRLVDKARAAAHVRPGRAKAEALRQAAMIDAAPQEAVARLAALMKGADAPDLGAAALAVVQRRLRACADALPASARFSCGFGRGLAYYDGMVFELEAPMLGAQSSLGGGGRYDGLLVDLAAASAHRAACVLTAAGFAVRPHRLALAKGVA